MGENSAKWATVAYLTNYFALFSLPRTLSNSLETIISILALAYFPRYRDTSSPSDDYDEDEEIEDSTRHVALAALTIIVRPTAIITWLPLWLPRLYSRKIEKEKRREFFVLLLRMATVAIAASVLLDSFCYGEFTFVPWQFLKVNVFHGVASLYGSHPFHWYFTQGFPVVLGPHLLPFLLALRQVWKLKFVSRVEGALQQYREMQQRKKDQKEKVTKKEKVAGVKRGQEVEKYTSEVEDGREVTLIKVIFWILAVYSLLGHKEFRFIFTTLPLAMCLVGKYFASLDG